MHITGRPGRDIWQGKSQKNQLPQKLFNWLTHYLHNCRRTTEVPDDKKNKKTVPQQNKNTEHLNKKSHKLKTKYELAIWIKIRKCFSHRDCVIKITSKASQPDTISLSITALFFVSLSGMFKRHHKAGLVSTMIDATALTGKCTLGPSEVYDVLVLHSGLHATLQSLVFTRNLTLLGLDVKWNMMLITQARLHF